MMSKRHRLNIIPSQILTLLKSIVQQKLLFQLLVTVSVVLTAPSVIAIKQFHGNSECLNPVQGATNIKTDVSGLDCRLSKLLYKSKETAFSRAIKDLVKALAQRAKEIAALEPPLDPELKPIHNLSGNSYVIKQFPTVKHEIEDFCKQQICATLYLPQKSTQSPAPVILISHGWRGSRGDYDILAKYLASRGFAVVATQHPGDTNRGPIFEEGGELINENEFIDRPSDVTRLLNELEKHYSEILDLNNVGMIGHSLGGYTSLVLAGAKINSAQLSKDCLSPAPSSNIALGLGCKILKLPDKDKSSIKQDSRIKAIFLLSPMGASIFGETGLKSVNTPVMWITGDTDPIIAVSSEHICSFQAIRKPEKYLAVAENATHVNWTSKQSLRIYMKTLSLAFFEVHLANNLDYRPYLQASYAQRISQSHDDSLYLIPTVPESNLCRLVEAIAEKSP